MKNNLADDLADLRNIVLALADDADRTEWLAGAVRALDRQATQRAEHYGRYGRSVLIPCAPGGVGG